MSEFEDRENTQALHELPEPISRERLERGGYENEGSRYGGVTFPPDIQQQHAVQQQPGEMGTVPRKFEITSVFDARPINGRDFMHTGIITLDIGSGI